MSEQLPDPNVIIPANAEALHAMVDDQRLELGYAKLSAESGSYDGQRNLRQARSNIDALLDHWPNGTPRDYIVQYGGMAAVAEAVDASIPANVEMGME